MGKLDWKRCDFRCRRNVERVAEERTVTGRLLQISKRQRKPFLSSGISTQCSLKQFLRCCLTDGLRKMGIRWDELEADAAMRYRNPRLTLTLTLTRLKRLWRTGGAGGIVSPNASLTRDEPGTREMVTTFTYKPSLVRIDARNFKLLWQQTHPQTNRQDRLQYTAPQLARSVMKYNICLYCLCIRGG